MILGTASPILPEFHPPGHRAPRTWFTTALGSSRVWASLGHGIINEVYWRSAGQPQIRDLGFIVASRSSWYEVKRVARYQLFLPKPYIPIPRVVHEGEGYRLELELSPDRYGTQYSSPSASPAKM